jgi:SpoVK/Ycf46/Vps4 family AAA+-type ATPase
MARADLILNLVDAASRSDTLMVRHTVEALAADERAKNHHVLADQLVAKIEQKPSNPVVHRLAATAMTDLWYERSPRIRLQDIVLSSELYSSIAQVIEEQHRSELLRAHGVEPRNRILLSGPPGNGKTTLAEAIAEALAVPLIVPRYESIVGSFLGETSQRLRQLFEYVSSRRCVLFFDEFDTVAKERADEHETGEIKRVVSSLLLQIDQLPSHVVVITATNHPELLDRAVWRRFQLRAELERPSASQITQWFALFGRRYGVDLNGIVLSLERHFKGANFSDLEEFAMDVLRQTILAGPDGDLKSVIQRQLRSRPPMSASPHKPRSASKRKVTRKSSRVNRRKK